MLLIGYAPSTTPFHATDTDGFGSSTPGKGACRQVSGTPAPHPSHAVTPTQPDRHSSSPVTRRHCPRGALPLLQPQQQHPHLSNTAEHLVLLSRDRVKLTHSELEDLALLLLVLDLGAHDAQLALRVDCLRLDLLKDLRVSGLYSSAGVVTFRSVSSERPDMVRDVDDEVSAMISLL